MLPDLDGAGGHGRVTSVVTDLRPGSRDRGLDTTWLIFVGIDGGKTLRAAVVKVSLPVPQLRNVADQLPKHLVTTVTKLSQDDALQGVGEPGFVLVVGPPAGQDEALVRRVGAEADDDVGGMLRAQLRAQRTALAEKLGEAS